MAAEVATAYGRLKGVIESGVHSFKGVPYGAPTWGSNRFMPARSPEPWTGVRDASSYGPSCPQMTVEQFTGHPLRPEAESMMGVLAQERTTGEDCLVLNIWSSTLADAARLPVLVWLHGGGWSTGSASWPLYVFDNLARRHDVVVVGVNHRVGVLGFLDLSALDAEFSESGNVGMLDIVAALRWVRDNIEAFGGDPNNVTVFGESGGGAKVTALLGMPSGRGLFHRACSMSGTLLRAQSPGKASEGTERIGTECGVDLDPRALQRVDSKRLIEAEVRVRGHDSLLARGTGLYPVLSPSLPMDPVDSVLHSSAGEVPVLIGCTSDEMLAFMIFEPDLWSMDDAALYQRFGQLVEEPDRLIEAYREIRPNDSPTSLFISLVSDAKMRLPSLRFAEALQRGTAPCYVYLFTFGITDPEGQTRSMHGSDMPYFFDNVDKAPVAQGPHAESLANAMSTALSCLAHDGKPGHAGLPEWPRYSSAERSTMIFDDPPRLVLDPFGGERQAWEGLDPPGLAGCQVSLWPEPNKLNPGNVLLVRNSPTQDISDPGGPAHNSSGTTRNGG